MTSALPLAAGRRHARGDCLGRDALELEPREPRVEAAVGRSALSCVPSSTIRPWSITMIRSAARTVARRWAMTIVVRSVDQPLERALDQPLAFRVERRGRLVEQQQRRVAQQRAGDGDALALAARQARAAFADDRCRALRAACAGTRRRWRASAAAQSSSSLASQRP